jgi:hypothetical protein
MQTFLNILYLWTSLGLGLFILRLFYYESFYLDELNTFGRFFYGVLFGPLCWFLLSLIAICKLINHLDRRFFLKKNE